MRTTPAWGSWAKKNGQNVADVHSAVGRLLYFQVGSGSARSQVLPRNKLLPSYRITVFASYRTVC